MAVSSGKTAFGQAVSYALTKVGKHETVLKNEQLTIVQHLLHCEGPTLTTSTYMHGSLSLSVNATRNICPKQPRRLACFASTVNKLVACFASLSERQKRHQYFKAILLHAEVIYLPHIFPLTASYIPR